MTRGAAGGVNRRDAGKATAYTIGMLEILETREQVRRVMEEDFDLRAFHDAVLENGALPLNVLPEVVHAALATGDRRRTPDARARPPRERL